MEFAVDMPQDKVLARAEAYFARRWPHGGDFQRHGSSVVLFGETRMLYGRLALELVKIALLGALTFGFYLIYWVFFKDLSAAAVHHGAEVLVFEDAEGTIVRVSGTKPEYRELLGAWVLEELGGRALPT